MGELDMLIVYIKPIIPILLAWSQFVKVSKVARIGRRDGPLPPNEEICG